MSQETRNLLGGLGGIAAGVLIYKVGRLVLGFGPSKVTWGQEALGLAMASSVLVLRWFRSRKAAQSHA